MANHFLHQITGDADPIADTLSFVCSLNYLFSFMSLCLTILWENIRRAIKTLGQPLDSHCNKEPRSLTLLRMNLEVDCFSS